MFVHPFIDSDDDFPQALGAVLEKAGDHLNGRGAGHEGLDGVTCVMHASAESEIEPFDSLQDGHPAEAQS